MSVNASALFLAPGLLSRSERKRKAREIIQASGVDSPEYFKDVVKQDTGVTFREQSEIWLQQFRIASANQFGRATRPQSREHWTSGFILRLGTFHSRTLTICPSNRSSERCLHRGSSHEL